MKIHENTKCHSNPIYLNNLNHCSEITVIQQTIESNVKVLHCTIRILVF